GNTTSGSGHSYTLDQTAPTAVATVTAIGVDTGSSNSDYITSTASQTVSGTLTGTSASRESIHRSADDATWVTATVSGSSWSASGVTPSAGPTPPLHDALPTAGNTTSGSGHSYTLDQTAPTAVATVTAIGADTGSSNSDYITSTA